MQRSHTRDRFASTSGRGDASFIDQGNESQKISALPNSVPEYHSRRSHPTLQAASIVRQANENEHDLLQFQQRALPVTNPYPMASHDPYFGASAIQLEQLAWEEHMRVHLHKYSRNAVAPSASLAGTLVMPRSMYVPEASMGSLLMEGYQRRYSDEVGRCQDRLESPRKRKIIQPGDQWPKKKPPTRQSSDSSSFPLPSLNGTAWTPKVLSLASFEQQWNSIIAKVEPLELSEAVKHDYTRRSFSTAIQSGIMPRKVISEDEVKKMKGENPQLEENGTISTAQMHSSAVWYVAP